MSTRLHALVLALGVAGAPWASAASGAEGFTKIGVDRDGVFRVTDAALAAAGTRVADRDIERLRLTLRGREVPLRLFRGKLPAAEGRFAVEFLGSFPRGEKTYEDEYTSTNVYVLDVAPPGTAPARVAVAAAPPSAAPARDASPYLAHHERNKKLIRFTGSSLPDEVWFWEEIKASDEKAAEIPIAADRVAPGARGRLRVRFVGYSHLPQDPDHTVDVSWNGRSLGKAVWDGETPFLFEKELEPGDVKDGTNTLSLRALGETTGGIDLVLLDWAELEYDRFHRLSSGEQTLLAASAAEPARVVAPGGTVRFWDTREARAYDVAARKGAALFAPAVGGTEDAAAGRYRAVAGPGLPPREIVVSRPANLRAAGKGADLVVVSHETFLPAARRLAEARRREGLVTEVVPVGDVYDVFRGGNFHPDAIREFLEHAWKSWAPKPRYVLLVGDASWDYKNHSVADEDYADWHWSPEWARQVPKNASVKREPSAANDRQFIPTYQYQSPWGHAASDNYFVTFSNAVDQPDLAIGRLPVGTAAEADAIVDKLLGYDQVRPGEFTNALFITNDEEGFQHQTDGLAEEASKRGYAITKVYPKREETNNAEHTKTLERAFDAGQALVLFNGHGGRYIWRTGPPDLKKNHDLFTLDNLDLLKETRGLPVVVSLTCYSAPFDHPIADSIGEKLLRMGKKGAVAVVASSWRNAPPLDLGRKMIEYLGSAERPRVGDAFVGAKQSTTDRVSLATYNLLGDPTTRFKAPPPTVAEKAGPAAKEGTNGTVHQAP